MATTDLRSYFTSKKKLSQTGIPELVKAMQNVAVADASADIGLEISYNQWTGSNAKRLLKRLSIPPTPSCRKVHLSKVPCNCCL